MQQILINPTTNEVAMYDDSGAYINCGVPENAALLSSIGRLVNFCDNYKTPEEKANDNLIALALKADFATAVESIKEWKPGERVKPGNYRKLDGVLYNALFPHFTSDELSPAAKDAGVWLAVGEVTNG